MRLCGFFFGRQPSKQSSHFTLHTPPKTNGWIPKMMGLGKGGLRLKTWPLKGIYVRFLEWTRIQSALRSRLKQGEILRKVLKTPHLGRLRISATNHVSVEDGCISNSTYLPFIYNHFHPFSTSMTTGERVPSLKLA